MLRSRNTSNRRTIFSNNITSPTDANKRNDPEFHQNSLTDENHKIFAPKRPKLIFRETKRRPKIPSNAIAQLNAVFLHFCRRSTIHGLNHMAQAKSAKRRIFWFTISLFASIGFFINLYYLIEKYVERQVLTNVFHDFDSFVYPDITICNVNPIYFPPNGTTRYKKLISTIKEYRELKGGKKKIQLADYLYMQKKDVYSHPAWSAIISCRYMQKTCDWRHFDVRRLWPYGNCFTFNARKMNMSRRVINNMRYNGFRPDFRIVVYKSLDYPKDHRFDPHKSLNVPSGILVMIHEAESYPHIGESFIVDDCTQIDLKIVLKSHLEKFSNCQSFRPRFTYADKVTKKNLTFLGRQSDCVYDIIQETLHKYCNCSWQTMPVNAKNINADYCLSESRNRGLLRQCFPMFNRAINAKNLRKCYRDLCTHTSYTTVISHSNYPAIRERNTHELWLEKLRDMEEQDMELYGRSDLAKKALLPDDNVTTIKQASILKRFDLVDVPFIERNFMMLRIVPASLFMDKVEESEEYPLSRLLSDIGGCVGLWVGASLITVFEFVDLLLDCTEVTSYRTRRMGKNCNGKTMGNNLPNTIYGNMDYDFDNTTGLNSALLREVEEEDLENDDDEELADMVVENKEDTFRDDTQVDILKLTPLSPHQAASASCSRTTSTITTNSFIFNAINRVPETMNEPIVQSNWDYGTTTDIVTSV